MRPALVFANLSAADRQRLVAVLHGPWRQALRAVMVLLSANGWSAGQIADLLGCDPVTVRRWIRRFDAEGMAGLADRPRSGRPCLGSSHLGERIAALLVRPGAWTTASVWRALGRPAIS